MYRDNGFFGPNREYPERPKHSKNTKVFTVFLAGLYAGVAGALFSPITNIEIKAVIPSQITETKVKATKKRI